MPTIKEILKVDNFDLKLLLSHTLKKDLSFLYIHPNYKLTFLENLYFKYYFYLLKKKFPVAYIVGKKEFYNLDFLVNKNTLIPRPETEIIVEEVLKKLLNSKNKTTLIDVGTGTGCIPISIIKNTKNKNIEIIAIDISKKALGIAKQNAKKYKTSINFLHGDLLTPILNTRDLKSDTKNQLLITANLPYLTSNLHKNETTIQKEPRQALVADNKNGLSLYEKLFKQILLLTEKYLSIFLIIEINPEQKEEAIKLIKKYFSASKIEIKKDLAGRDRTILIEI